MPPSVNAVFQLRSAQAKAPAAQVVQILSVVRINVLKGEMSIVRAPAARGGPRQPL